MDTSPTQADAELQDGVGLSTLLAAGALLGALGWAFTQFVAMSPGFGLATVGVEGTVLVVAFWLVATVALVAAGIGVGARFVRYSPLLWFWGVLVGGALALDAAALFGLVGPQLRLMLLFTPWPVVLAVGFGVTGIVATHRNRGAYLVGALAAALVALAVVLFPTTVPDWAFVATGVVHALPLLVDARTDEAADSDGTASYEFRDVSDATSEDNA